MEDQNSRWRGALYGYPVDEYRNQLIKNNLQTISVDSTFEELPDNSVAVLYKARYFDSRFATFYWISHDTAKDFGLEQATAAINFMNKTSKLLQANFTTLQYHPHGREYMLHGNCTLLDYMLENVEHAAC